MSERRGHLSPLLGKAQIAQYLYYKQFPKGNFFIVLRMEPKWVQIGYRELAQELQIKESSVRRYVTELVNEGLLERKLHGRAPAEYRISRDAVNQIGDAYWNRRLDKPKNWRKTKTR